jgi:hypothetical protein
MTDPRKVVLMQFDKRSLQPYADLQMLLPTMDVYLSEQFSVTGKLIAKAPTRRRKAPATIAVWERLF